MTPLQLYRKYYPHVPLNFVQEGLINEVKNLDVWGKCLVEWSGNGWRGSSVFRLTQFYEEKMRKYGADEPDPVIVCSRCNDIKTVMVPREGREYNWEMESVPCPECAVCV